MKAQIAEILQDYYPDLGCNEKAAKKLTALFEEQRRFELIQFSLWFNDEPYAYISKDIIDDYLKQIKP